MQIKICGLRRPEDIDYVNATMPDYAGFILGFPRSHRSIEAPELRSLRRKLAPGIRAVGVFVDADPAYIAQLYNEDLLDIAQLHGSEDEEYIQTLRAHCPGLILWQAFRVQGPKDITAACASSADQILLDAGQGSGRSFDWSHLRQIERPYMLAGGLDAKRIEAAAALPHILGVDVSSGVETSGVKDFHKIKEAVSAARRK